MTISGFILDPDEWQRLLAFAADLTGSESYAGQRAVNILSKKGWTQFTSLDFSRACTVLTEHYAAKAKLNEMGEPEGFEIGANLAEYSAAVWIKAARIAYEHRRNKKFLSGLSAGLGGYSASQMAQAVVLWPEWFAEELPRASTVNECRTLFALASLPVEQAQIAYLYWREHLTATLFEMYQYVRELKAQVRLKDLETYPAHRRKTLQDLGRMKETAKGEKQETIGEIIKTVKEKL